MAYRKRDDHIPQIHLSFRGPSLSPSPAAIPQPIPSPPMYPPPVSVTDLRTARDVDLEVLDDYDDAPKLHLADPPRQVSIIVECLSGDRFEVSRLRDSGTTVAAVMYTRKELIELVS